MADYYPKSFDEVVAENTALRAMIAQLEQRVSSLRSDVVSRDSDIERLRKPKWKPRALDANAEDSFQRPARFSGR